jgi:large subunit ribosomal protein L25
MEVGKLTVQVRNNSGKGAARRLRSDGLVPGICYGAGLDQPLAITVNAKALKASLDPAKGRNTVISVAVEGGSTAELTAMLWDYQVDPIRRNVVHVDLIAIDPQKEIEVEVPVVLVGKHKGAIEGGQLHVERHSIPVRCLPRQIPARFDVDVTPMAIGDALHVSDVPMPEGVVPAVPGEFSVVSCQAPKAEKETAATTTEAAPAAAAAAPAAGKGAAPAAAAKGAAPAAAKAPAKGGDKK